MAPSVDILMATYNGVQFLDDQLRSILTQTVDAWTLFIRDDGSNDGSAELLRGYESRFPEKIRIVRDAAGRRGVVGNFSRLLEVSTSDVVLFCDQDDVWLPNKIEISLREMDALAAVHGFGCPLLVFTDLTVVDEELRTIAPSFWRRKRIDPSRVTTPCLLTQNVVTGCTAVINRALLEIARPIPDAAVVHDWWVALLAALLGHLTHVPAPTVLYRQHGRNDIGARGRSLVHDAAQLADLRAFRSWIRSFRLRTVAQAQALLDRAASMVPVDEPTRMAHLAVIRRYAQLDRLPFLERKHFLLRNGLLCGDTRSSLVKLATF